jgi:hypothetical protein
VQNRKGGSSWEPQPRAAAGALQPDLGSFFFSPDCLSHTGLAHGRGGNPRKRVKRSLDVLRRIDIEILLGFRGKSR